MATARKLVTHFITIFLQHKVYCHIVERSEWDPTDIKQGVTLVNADPVNAKLVEAKTRITHLVNKKVKCE